MADINSEDYYEQVAEEAKEEITRETQEIEACVSEVTTAAFNSLYKVLGQEFGWAVVRISDMRNVKSVLRVACESAAAGARSIMAHGIGLQTRSESPDTED